MEATTALEAGREARTATEERPPALGRRDAVVFVVLATWVTLGVYLDGFAHAELTTP